jgi:hypothetical protein
MGSPFAALSAAPKPTEQQPQSQDRGILFYDLEAIPDESRYPKPESNELSSSIPDEDFRPDDILTDTKTVTNLQKWLKGHKLSGPQYARLLEQENQGDTVGRATAIDTIEKLIKSGTVEFDSWLKESSTNPWKARIVAFGWCIGNGETKSMTARNDDEERALLEQFWRLNTSDRTRCGYNICGYDDILVAMRSRVLGVEQRKLDFGRFSNKEAIDLMVKLFPSRKAMKCKEVAYALGIVPPAGDVDGSQVYWMYQREEMDAIAHYVESDVFVEQEMYFATTELWKF